jgi:hypothetical protein
MSLQKKLDDAMKTFMTQLADVLSKTNLDELFESDKAPAMPAPEVVKKTPQKSPARASVEAIRAARIKKAPLPEISPPSPIVPEQAPDATPTTIQVQQDDLGRFFATVNGKTLISTRQRSLIPRLIKAGVAENNIARCISAKALNAAKKRAEKSATLPMALWLPEGKTEVAVSVTPEGKHTATVQGKTYTFSRERDLRRKLQGLQYGTPMPTAQGEANV